MYVSTEPTLCSKKYIGKAETVLADTKNPNVILACKHFQQQGHNFNSHAKFIIIDKLVNKLALKTFYVNA